MVWGGGTGARVMCCLQFEFMKCNNLALAGAGAPRASRPASLAICFILRVLSFEQWHYLLLYNEHLNNGITCSSTMSTTEEKSEDRQSHRRRRQDAQANMSHVWANFNRALRSMAPFNQWHWMRLLFVAGVRYAYHQSRMAVLVDVLRLDEAWRPLVPAFGLSLVAFVEVAYFTKLREPFVVRMWCKPCEAQRQQQYGAASCILEGGTTTRCLWDIIFSSIAIYFGVMIVYHYMNAVFSSPGVVLPAEDDNDNDKCDQRNNAKLMVQNCMKGRGGCCFINTAIDVASERRLVSKYPSASIDEGDEDVKDGGDNEDDDRTRYMYFPSPFVSQCKKCNVTRPARAHHCSTCNRCILQFDHHCPWVNNCIGFGNYRSFFLTVFYVTLGAWYGFLLLAPPFFRHMKNKFETHGFAILMRHKTGLLDLPPPWIILEQAMTTGIEPDVLLRMVVPLLIGACLVMTSFLAYHLRYVCVNLTTLEHSIILGTMKKELDKKGAKEFSKTYQKPINPFDHGWRRNIAQAVGPSILAFFLPIPVHPRTPMAPKRKNE